MPDALNPTPEEVARPDVDWGAFSDCVLSTNWSRAIDLKREFGFSQSTTMAIWHGRPVGLVPFLRVCRAMNIEPCYFLVNLPDFGANP